MWASFYDESSFAKSCCFGAVVGRGRESFPSMISSICLMVCKPPIGGTCLGGVENWAPQPCCAVTFLCLRHAHDCRSSDARCCVSSQPHHLPPPTRADTPALQSPRICHACGPTGRDRPQTPSRRSGTTAGPCRRWTGRRSTRSQGPRASAIPRGELKGEAGLSAAQRRSSCEGIQNAATTRWSAQGQRPGGPCAPCGRSRRPESQPTRHGGGAGCSA